MRIFTNPDELVRAAGSPIGMSSWRRIEQTQVDAFAEVTGDRQWIHVDADRAAAGPFASTIAHGFLTLSLLTALVEEIYRVDGAAMTINYGLDRVRFITPVITGSRVRARVEFADLTRTTRGLLLRSNTTIELDGNPKPACVAEALTLFVSQEES
jgi:acyl dehydratase